MFFTNAKKRTDTDNRRRKKPHLNQLATSIRGANDIARPSIRWRRRRSRDIVLPWHLRTHGVYAGLVILGLGYEYALSPPLVDAPSNITGQQDKEEGDDGASEEYDVAWG